MRTRLSLRIVLSLLCMSILATAGTPVECTAAQPLQLEILFMNHGPMQPTIRNLKALFKRNAGRVRVSWFDFDKQSGKSFMATKGIKGHIPLLIYINGDHTFDFGGRKVTFMGFPTGKGPFRQVQGKWTVRELEQVIHSLAR